MLQRGVPVLLTLNLQVLAYPSSLHPQALVALAAMQEVVTASNPGSRHLLFRFPSPSQAKAAIAAAAVGEEDRILWICVRAARLDGSSCGLHGLGAATGTITGTGTCSGMIPHELHEGTAVTAPPLVCARCTALCCRQACSSELFGESQAAATRRSCSSDAFHRCG